MSRFMERLTGILVVIAIVAVSLSTTAAIRIGLLLPLTGLFAEFGSSARDGAELAIAEWNGRGGVLGHMIEAILVDTSCNPQIASTAVEKLLYVYGANFIVGGLCPSPSVAASEVANSSGALMISLDCSLPAVTVASDGINKPYVFRVCFLDDFQARANATFAINELGANTAAVLHNVRNDRVTVLARLFKDAFLDLGGEVPVFEGYSPDDADFTALLAKVAEANADVLFCPDYPPQVNLIGAQAKEMGLRAVMMGSDGWQTADLDCEALDGSYFSAHYSPDDPRPLVSEHRAAFKERYGKEPDFFSVMAYDATNALLIAMEEAGTEDPEVVKDALANLQFEGVSGSTKFDEHGDPVKEVPIHRVDKDEAFVFVEVVVVPPTPTEAEIWVAILDIQESTKMIQEGLEQETVSVDELQDWVEMFENDIEQLANWSAEDWDTHELLSKLESFMRVVLDLLVGIRDQVLTNDEALSALADIEHELESDASALLAKLGDWAEQQATELRDANLAVPPAPELPPEGETPSGRDDYDLEACRRRWSDPQFLESLLLDDISIEEVLEFVGNVDDFCSRLFEEEIEPIELELFDMTEGPTALGVMAALPRDLAFTLPVGASLASSSHILNTVPTLLSQTAQTNPCKCTWTLAETLVPDPKVIKRGSKTTTASGIWWKEDYNKWGTFIHLLDSTGENCFRHTTDTLDGQGSFLVSLKVECTPTGCCNPQGWIVVFATHESLLEAETDVDGCIFVSSKGGAQAHEVADLFINASRIAGFTKPTSAAVGEQVSSSVTASIAPGKSGSRTVTFTSGSTSATGTKSARHIVSARRKINTPSVIAEMRTLSYVRVSNWRKARSTASITPLVTGIGLIALETKCSKTAKVYFSPVYNSSSSEAYRSAKKVFEFYKKHYLPSKYQ